MASSLGTLVSRGLQRLSHLQGDPVFTFQGSDIPCNTNNLMRGMVIEIGGLPVEISFSVAALIEDMPIKPVAGQTIIYEEQTYRIVRVTDSGGIYYELHLADPNSGR